MSQPLHRRIGTHRGADGHFTRVVDHLELHGDPIPFSTLMERAIPKDTRYIVFDLDNTLHFRRNMGELLGWELVAYHTYGPERLREIQAGRGPGRFLFPKGDLRASLSLIRQGIRLWAWPGLYYFAWCKMAAKLPRLKRLSFRHFGPEPVSTVQKVPQSALLSQMANVPLDVLRDLSAQVWARYSEDQVISKDDIDALRIRCPQARIIISSASPQPVLEIAAQNLGIDDIVFSKVDVNEGILGAPFWLRTLLEKGDLPKHITPPSRQRLNAGYNKIGTLLEQFPDILDPGVVSVGVSDTGYGEDHSWAQYFTHVLDVNSKTPFPPIVSSDSPLETIHSARLLTAHELRQRKDNPTYLSPRRKAPTPLPHRIYHKDALEKMLQGELSLLESIGERIEIQASTLAPTQEALKDAASQILTGIEEAIDDYNQALEGAREDCLKHIDAWVTKSRRLSKRLAQLQRPMSEALFSLTRTLEAARSSL